jgi:ribulose-phosphate 3-epimerase
MNERSLSFELGVKSDPIEYRYSYEWLFRLMERLNIYNLQLGTFFEFYDLEDSWFRDLRELASRHGIRIRSVFTAHRELGGFFTGDPRLERVARRNFERLIKVASLLGARYAGSNPGAVYRDQMSNKAAGIARYTAHMKELSIIARKEGLAALTIEPMSCMAEPPSSKAEIAALMNELAEHHQALPEESVPVYLCGDISHGLADCDKNIIEGNYELFEFEIPWTCEFHIKNTDRVFGSTFGFTEEDRDRGNVDMSMVMNMVWAHENDWPVKELVGYLEIGGPKLGRDWSDYALERQIEDSLIYLKRLNHESRGRPAQ